MVQQQSPKFSLTFPHSIQSIKIYLSILIAAYALFGLITITTVHGGFVDYDLVIVPSDVYLHYNDGYIVAPGFIDLGSLSFEPISSASVFVAGGSDDDSSSGDSGNDDNRRWLYESSGTTQQQKHQALHQQLLTFSNATTENTNHHQQLHSPPARLYDNESRVVRAAQSDDSSVLDIVIVHLPQYCARSRYGCDYTELGIGKRTIADDAATKTAKGTLNWCCSDLSIQLGLCTQENFGRLLIDTDKFTGNHREVIISNTEDTVEKIKYGKMEEKVSGTYVVVFAHCNTKNGRDILVQGESVWKSKNGYLPGELYGFMYFFVGITVVYFVLWTCYGYAMKVNVEYRIEIEKWVMLAISLGLFEMIFRSIDYFVWNIVGYRNLFVIYVGVILGVLKQGISRCLIVMVSLGWGVVRDTLGSTMKMIVLLGALYIGLSIVRDLMVIFAVEDMYTLSVYEEKKILNVARLLTIFISAIDVLFILWILDALNNTMIYLETMNQARKLDRYNKLRCLFMFSILFATMWAVFTLVDTVNDEGLVQEEHAWAIEAATEVNYLFVLIGVAMLWRPNPNAQEYAYVMELSTTGGTDDDDTNGIELGSAVPSAADGDDDDDNNNNGSYGNGRHKEGSNYNDDDDDGHDGRFQIS